MRHGSITLTMDTYGHLLPGHESQAAGRLGDMLAGPDTDVVRATGTDDATSDGAQRQAQRAGRETLPDGARACAGDSIADVKDEPPNPLRIEEISDKLLAPASPCDVDAPLAQLAEQLTLNQ